MPLRVDQVQSNLQKGKDYVLTSDYDVLWVGGNHSSILNRYNDYVETVNIPGTAIQTNESRTANSLVAKIGSELTYEDLEISWRIPSDFEIFYTIEKWMSDVKAVDTNGYVTTGYFDDYCKKYKCQIKRGSTSSTGTKRTIVEINGLYPINRQAISFSTEGNEYVKFTVTFACYRISVDSSV
jgi:hypothetical protein